MNDKDVKAVFDLFYEFHDMDNLGLLRSKLVEYITTVRKEAREAAFKDALRAINNMEVVITRFQSRSADMNGWYSAIKQAHTVIKAIEAATNTEEGGRDG